MHAPVFFVQYKIQNSSLTTGRTEEGRHVVQILLIDYKGKSVFHGQCCLPISNHCLNIILTACSLFIVYEI